MNTVVRQPNQTTRKRRLLAILPVLGQPRLAKRLDNLQAKGFKVSVLAFTRQYHSGRLPDCPTEVIGSIVDGNYVRRLISLFRALPKIRRSLSSADAIYAFSPDMALVAIMARGFRRVPLLLEVGDITRIQTASGVRGWLFRMIDRGIVSQCQLLVVTAPRFETEYYKKWLRSKTPCLVVENKVESSFAVSVREKLKKEKGPRETHRRLRIGYFGTLRSSWELDVLSEIANRHGEKFRVIIAGLPRPWLNFSNYLEKAPGFKYLGTYKSPDDLYRLYGGVDLTWLCLEPFDGKDWNSLWLRANRFYESCTFKKPIIVRAGAGDAVDVACFGIGVLVNSTSPQEAADWVAEHVGRREVEQWRLNMESVPYSVFSYTVEFEILAEEIRGLIDKKR